MNLAFTAYLLLSSLTQIEQTQQCFEQLIRNVVAQNTVKHAYDYSQGKTCLTFIDFFFILDKVRKAVNFFDQDWSRACDFPGRDIGTVQVRVGSQLQMYQHDPY